VLALSVEFRSYKLDLVDGFRGIAELAWRTEPLRVRGTPKPKLIDSSEGEIQPHFVAGTVFAEIEGHPQHSTRVFQNGIFMLLVEKPIIGHDRLRVICKFFHVEL
jgi:hypothetical protein